MKKPAILLTLAAVLVFAQQTARSQPVTVTDSAAAAILVDAATETVLYGHDVDTPMLIASTTKILTALVVLENCDSSETVRILPEYTGIEGSTIYLAAGEVMSVKDLLYGMLLESGNDAAVALACHTAGEIDTFAELMNEKAASLGCKDSHFKNPHGLDGDEHYSTAYDLARISIAAMENEELREIVSTKSIYAAGRSFVNHNKLLWNCEGVIGLKTGYTMSAGRSLVSCAQRGGAKLICVTLGDRDDWRDHAALYDWAFSTFERITISKSYDIPVVSGVCSAVTAAPERECTLLASSEDIVDILVSLPKFVYAPVKAGAPAGYVSVSVNGEEVEHVRLLYTADVGLDKSVPLRRWERIKWAWYYANRHTVALPLVY